MVGWARPTRLNGRPFSSFSSGTVIHSAMASNMEMEISAPSLAARARDQRFEDRLIGVEACGNVDDGDADARRRFRPAGHRGEAGLRLDQQIVGLALRIGAALAIAGDRAADQPRIIPAQR